MKKQLGQVAIKSAETFLLVFLQHFAVKAAHAIGDFFQEKFSKSQSQSNFLLTEQVAIVPIYKRISPKRDR